MTDNAQKKGMTPERLEEIQKWLRESSYAGSGPNTEVPRNAVSDEEAAMLGMELMNEIWNMHLTGSADTDNIEKLIARGAKVDFETEDGRTPLMQASRDGQKEVVEVLISARANVNLETHMGITALMWASRCGYGEIASMLIDNMADINMAGSCVQNAQGTTALMASSWYGQTKVVEMLIHRGADVMLKSDNGWTALMWASDSEQKSCVEALIPHVVDVNEKDKEGWTALMHASKCKYTNCDESVKVLISAGADAKLVNNDGETAMDIARNERVKKILEDSVKAQT